MKKFVAMLLVLTMVLALAGTAMAACKIKVGPVKFIKNANTYSAPRASKKNVSVVKKGSQSICDKVCASKKFARVITSPELATRWFKVSALEQMTLKAFEATGGFKMIWSKGGKDMSIVLHVGGGPVKIPGLKGKIKVTGHTNLRKGPSLQGKSQGVVECGDMLTLTGRAGMDSRGVIWFEVVGKKCKKLWVSGNFVKLNESQKDAIFGGE